MPVASVSKIPAYTASYFLARADSRSLLFNPRHEKDARPRAAPRLPIQLNTECLCAVQFRFVGCRVRYRAGAGQRRCMRHVIACFRHEVIGGACVGQVVLGASRCRERKRDRFAAFATFRCGDCTDRIATRRDGADPRASDFGRVRCEQDPGDTG